VEGGLFDFYVSVARHILELSTDINNKMAEKGQNNA